MKKKPKICNDTLELSLTYVLDCEVFNDRSLQPGDVFHSVSTPLLIKHLSLTQFTLSS